MKAAQHARKAVQSAESPAQCYCRHSREDHAGGKCGRCECGAYLQRPCFCGHVVERHSLACKDPGCKCARFREDRSPEYVLRMGLRNGDWQISLLPRMRALMRPDVQPKTRYYACLMLHADDRRGRASGHSGRLAVKVSSGGKTSPLQPGDVVQELNSYDPEGLGRITKMDGRKYARQLERDGLVRQVGKTKGLIRLYVYARPLKARSIAPEPELVEPDPTEECGEFGRPTSLPNVPNPHDHNWLQTSISMPIRRTIVKVFMRELRHQGETGNLVGQPAYQKLIDETLDEVDLVVQRAYQKLALVGCGDSNAIYKERARASSIFPIEESLSSSSSSTRESGTTTTDAPAKGRKKTAEMPASDSIVVEEALAKHGPAETAQAEELIAGCRKLAPDCSAGQIVHFIDLKALQIPRGVKNRIAYLCKCVLESFASRTWRKQFEQTAPRRQPAEQTVEERVEQLRTSVETYRQLSKDKIRFSPANRAHYSELMKEAQAELLKLTNNQTAKTSGD